MDIEYLYEFTVIAKLESFSRAAETLNISQSSLSKHILTLERELGAPLLQRSSRRVSMTPFGAEVFPLAQEVSQLKNRIRAAADAQSSRSRRTLSILSIPVMAQYGITDVVAAFGRQNPAVNLEVREVERQELRELLEQGAAELAFARQGLEPEEDLEVLPLVRDRLVAAVAVSHPLADRNYVNLLELREEPLLFLDQQTGFHHLYASLCKKAGFVPQIAYTGHRPENILSLAAQGMGVGLLMEGHVNYVNTDALRILPLRPEAETWICLTKLRDRPLSGLGRSFWKFVAEHYGAGREEEQA